jgi:hypothetical protein
MNTSSRLLLLPFLALMFLFQGCNDDDGEVSRREILIGAWTIETNELSDYTITVSGFTFTKDNVQGSPFEAEAQELEENLELLADEIFPPNTTITFSEDNTYILTNAQNSTAPESWSLSSNEQELTLNIDDDEIDRLIFDIQELTNNSLHVLLILDENDLDLGVEEIDSYTIEYTFRFTK